MRVADALKLYGSHRAIAEVLKISANAVYQWDELVPPLSAARLAKRSKGKLKFDPDVYGDRYDHWNRA